MDDHEVHDMNMGMIILVIIILANKVMMMLHSIYDDDDDKDDNDLCGFTLLLILGVALFLIFNLFKIDQINTKQKFINMFAGHQRWSKVTFYKKLVKFL